MPWRSALRRTELGCLAALAPFVALSGAGLLIAAHVEGAAADALTRAPVCAGAPESGCRGEVPVAATAHRHDQYVSGGRYSSRTVWWTVDVSSPGYAATDVRLDEQVSGASADAISTATSVVAEVWQDKLVAVRLPDGTRVPTVFDPVRSADTNQGWGLALLVVGLSLSAAEGTVLTGLRLARRWSTEAPPAYAAPYHRWPGEE